MRNGTWGRNVGGNGSTEAATSADKRGTLMKKVLAAIMSVAFLGAMTPMADAQSPCPPEVAQAKAMISKIANRQDVQAPRGKQDVQAPRGQDVQAPRGKQDVQAPRGQDVQAPRGQDVQAPR